MNFDKDEFWAPGMEEGKWDHVACDYYKNQPNEADSAWPEIDKLTTKDGPNLFHITDCGDELKTLTCRGCGSSEGFEVGVGEYYTAIKCKACLWEICIHSG